jgi:hypothetical protein
MLNVENKNEEQKHQDFALSLRHAGYKNVTDFRVVGSGSSGAV